MINHAICLLVYARSPFKDGWIFWVPRLRYVPGMLSVSYSADLHSQLKKGVLAQLASAFRPQCLFLIHTDLPHVPIIYLEDGSIDEINATFISQLKYTDRVWGEYLDILHQTKLYDSSWVIFTSDHDIFTSDAKGDHRHVPLLIKPPAGTYTPRQVDTPVSMWEMGDFFRAVFAGRPAEECLALLPTDARADIHLSASPAFER